MINKLFIHLVHAFFPAKKFNGRIIAQYAKQVQNKKILEIGSGKQVKNSFPYSVKDNFAKSNNFLCTDINAEFGHRVLDITNSDHINEQFDLVICLNVLEHVFEYQSAIENLNKCLTKNGTLLVSVPAFYPLHDEPHDYWRFTEHALKRIFSDFKLIKFHTSGIRKFPNAYFLVLEKK